MCRKIGIFLSILLVAAIWLGTPSLAQDKDLRNSSGLPIPRFVSLKSDKVFVRAGPGLRYPIKWVFKKEGLPVEIVQEFDTWRKIRDQDGEEGWVHQTLLSGKRTAMVTADKGGVLMRKPVTGASPVAVLEPKVLVALAQCHGAWCSAEAEGFKGWIERKSLWGIYATEELD